MQPRQFLGRGSKPVDRSDDIVHQLVHVERGAVGELAFGQRPDAFIGIEFGRVSRKVLDVQAWIADARALPKVHRDASEEFVQQNDDGTPRRCRSSSRRNRHTSSWPMLSK